MAGFFPIDGQSLGEYKGWTLVMPAVSVGNVGQIAVDLVLATAKLPKIGFWLSPSVIPVVCNDPLATKTKKVKGSISLAVEFFRCVDRKLVIMQRRSPLTRGGDKRFSKNITAWAEKSGFSSIIVASSSQAYLNDQGSQNKFWCTYTNPSPKTVAVIKNLKLLYKSLSPARTLDAKSIPDSGVSAVELLRNGSELTRALLENAKEAKIEALAVLAQVTEGDNLVDGQELALLLSNLLKALGEKGVKAVIGVGKKFKIPFAYEHVYGPPPDRQIYT
ncbi:hypothetical protein AAMO2058_000940500 [Amorphochlora amoebiformis]